MARSLGPPKDPPPNLQGAHNHKLCGVVQEAAARANERHRKRTKPQPWIVRKLMIGVTLGIMGYAAYVYIRQVCLPMVWRREGAGAGRGTGVVLLVVFCVLYLWMLWAYAMVCLTSPGYAKDHVPKTERPLIPNGPFHHDSWASTTETDAHTHTTSQWPHDPEAPIITPGMGPRLSFQSQTHQPRRSSVSGTTSRTHGTGTGTGRPGSPLGTGTLSGRARSQSHSQSLSVQRHHDGLAGPSYEDLLRRDAGRLSPSQSHSQAPPSPWQQAESGRQDPNAGVLDALKRPVPFPAELRAGAGAGTEGVPPASPTEQTRTSETAHSHSHSHSNSNGHAPPNPKNDVPSSPTRDHTSPTSPSFFPSKLKLKKPRPARATLSSPTSASTPTSTMKHEKALATERRLQALNVTRKPPMAPVLEPAHRYCSVDGLVKPFRAHHCRVCGTCVLKYDHHCPWIGQCVGARNHKYFLNFNQATTILTAYVLGTTVAYTVRASTSSPLGGTDVHPQEIVLIALSALFLLFTLLLTASHTHLILNGQTTVESMQIRSMREREDRTLARGFAWWDFGAKRRKQREWDQEWGRIGKEGYIWWRGSQYEHWVDVMGTHWWGWILPIGRGGGDGLNYPVNPRFDAQGRWRRRAEWPEELR